MLSKLIIEFYYHLFNFKQRYFKLVDIEVDGIDTRDAPDFCDAFICGASWHIPLLNVYIEANEVDLEYLNEDSDLVYESVQETLY